MLLSVVRGAGDGQGDLSPWLAAATKPQGAVAAFPTSVKVWRGLQTTGVPANVRQRSG